MTEYNVVLKDADGCDIVVDKVHGLPAAKKQAKHFLTDDYARVLGTSHVQLGTHKVEVRNSHGECLFDAFRDSV